MKFLIAIIASLLLAVVPTNAAPSRNSSAPPPDGTLTTILSTTTIAGTNTLPFMAGICLPEGAATVGDITTDAMSSQVVAERVWNDGSFKCGVVSGTESMTGGSPSTIHVMTGVPASGTSLTCPGTVASSGIAAALNLGTSGGSVSLASLLSTPYQRPGASAPEYAQGKEMVECEYHATASGGTNSPAASIWFYVDYFKSGAAHIRVAARNGWVDQASSNQSVTLTFTVCGRTIAGPTSMTLYQYTEWDGDAWCNISNPRVVAAQSPADVVSAKLYPNFYMDRPSAKYLNGLHQAYAYNSPGDYNASMGDTGPQDQIGILTRWDSTFVTSIGDSRAYNAMLADAEMIGNFATVWRGHSDNDGPLRPSIYPNYSDGGNNQGGGPVPAIPASPKSLQYDICHRGGEAYTAYLATGDLFFAEKMEDVAATAYLTNSVNHGSGTNRTTFFLAARCWAWATLDVMMIAAVAPIDGVESDWASNAAAIASASATVTKLSGVNGMHVMYEYDLFGVNGACRPYSDEDCSFFMHWFAGQVYEFSDLIQPLSGSDAANLKTAADWLAYAVVQQLGDGAGTTSCFTQAGNYNWAFGSNKTTLIRSLTDTNFFADWNHAWNGSATLAAGGDPNLFQSKQCNERTLQGSGGATPIGPQSFWDNLVPEIALAVTRGVSGAPAAYARLTGAFDGGGGSGLGSWRYFRTCGGTATCYGDEPQFGVEPIGSHL